MVVQWWGWGEYRLSFLMVHTKGEREKWVWKLSIVKFQKWSRTLLQLPKQLGVKLLCGESRAVGMTLLAVGYTPPWAAPFPWTTAYGSPRVAAWAPCALPPFLLPLCRLYEMPASLRNLGLSSLLLGGKTLKCLWISLFLSLTSKILNSLHIIFPPTNDWWKSFYYFGVRI